MRLFRDRRSRPQESLSTLRAAVADDYARLACRWWPTTTVWDLHPQGFTAGFTLLTQRSPRAQLCWRDHGPNPFGRRPIGGFLRTESDLRFRLLDCGFIRLCPVSSGSGHVRSYAQTDRRVRLSGSLCLEGSDHSRPLNRLFSSSSTSRTHLLSCGDILYISAPN